MELSDQVLRVLSFERISEGKLAEMLKKAAITRLRGFNRRYFHWIFKTECDVLVAMQHVEIIEIGNGDTRMLEEHDACDGAGCHGCGWVGQIGRWVTDRQLASGIHPLPKSVRGQPLLNRRPSDGSRGVRKANDMNLWY